MQTANTDRFICLICSGGNSLKLPWLSSVIRVSSVPWKETSFKLVISKNNATLPYNMVKGFSLSVHLLVICTPGVI